MIKKHKDISRMDQESKRSHGWYVRVRFNGDMQTKLFSDKKSGGRQAALDAAISWRNDTEKNLGKVRSDKNVVTVNRSKTGVPGVHISKKLNCYIVSWVTPDGRQGKTSVSIGKYGKETAFTRACSIRHQKEQERLES